MFVAVREKKTNRPKVYCFFSSGSFAGRSFSLSYFREG